MKRDNVIEIISNRQPIFINLIIPKVISLQIFWFPWGAERNGVDLHVGRHIAGPLPCREISPEPKDDPLQIKNNPDDCLALRGCVLRSPTFGLGLGTVRTGRLLDQLQLRLFDEQLRSETVHLLVFRRRMADSVHRNNFQLLEHNLCCYFGEEERDQRKDRLEKAHEARGIAKARNSLGLDRASNHFSMVHRLDSLRHGGLVGHNGQ